MRSLFNQSAAGHGDGRGSVSQHSQSKQPPLCRGSTVRAARYNCASLGAAAQRRRMDAARARRRPRERARRFTIAPLNSGLSRRRCSGSGSPKKRAASAVERRMRCAPPKSTSIQTLGTRKPRWPVGGRVAPVLRRPLLTATQAPASLARSPTRTPVLPRMSSRPVELAPRSPWPSADENASRGQLARAPKCRGRSEAPPSRRSAARFAAADRPARGRTLPDASQLEHSFPHFPREGALPRRPISTRGHKLFCTASGETRPVDQLRSTHEALGTCLRTPHASRLDAPRTPAGRPDAPRTRPGRARTPAGHPGRPDANPPRPPM